MMRCFRVTLAAMLAACAAVCAAKEPSRVELNMNGDWAFYRGDTAGGADPAVSAAEWIPVVLPHVMQDRSRLGVVSINTPNLPPQQIRGIKTAVLGPVKYHEWFNVVRDEGEKVTYSYSGTPKNMDCWSAETDARLVREGYATISSVKYDQSDAEGNAVIEKWELAL